MLKVKVKDLRRTNKVTKDDLICDICGKSAIDDKYVYLDKVMSKGYCEKCFRSGVI